MLAAFVFITGPEVAGSVSTKGSTSPSTTLRASSARRSFAARARARIKRGTDADALGDDALGLLDHDPAVQRGLQLRRDVLAALNGPLLQDPDSRDVSESRNQIEIGLEP